jgi:hypothetical protein
MQDNPKEADWKKFRKMVPVLRERYLEKLIPELTAMLQNEKQTPTERFWNASERTEEIGKILRTCLDGHTRSRMMSFLLLMIRHQMMTEEDLKGFSDELREQIDRVRKLG